MTSTGLADIEEHLALLAGVVHDAVSVERLLSHFEVVRVKVLARAGALAEANGPGGRVLEHDMALRAIAAELGGAVQTSDRAMQRRIGEARTIVEDYPAALKAWELGRITRGHVRVIVDAGANLPADVRPAFEAVAVERCRHDTPNRVRAEVEILAQQMHPRSFTERHQDAAAGRAVRIVPGRDGMSDLVATLPTVLAEGIHDRLTRQARAIVDTSGERSGSEVVATDERTTDQVRADVLADLLLAGTPALDDTRDTSAGPLGAIRARAQVVVPALAFAGHGVPCDLVGRSPIDADTARRLAGDTPSWERLVTDPVTGTVLATDTYRVPLALRRHLQARDQHCRFPGCRLAAIRCEVDHTRDHALGGPTEVGNLAHLCQRHHSMKQFTAWRVRQLGGGVLEWTSPLGRTYREDAPTPAVAFTPAERPPVAGSSTAAGEPAPF
ncbi:HNH endonuclease [Microbacterium sp. EYE_5]|uniref:HNH endonuclease signature motif containing protein n=1 Tax=unclassified Microbacterium TaxID=2609290 RepID=UPI002003C61C|nr:MULTISPECIES: HNH endonuclease signature motif containing protein [unclassified Microbacterium]MCK6081279.1 HNH endonuclease [Microbacterium sp. EYE_382]MCK6086549.1 HNH endonuclease [Microbacterium sp. EYE_384]MCK6123953.1 HNH endonuclease [Microbacterium sp. EYE_80]MCK6126862.1 HNH endonuclease [Microbacterium sp. EYE_79]MCK6142234.1 HNH endonuclease [Microbacterium sp. EYE_39]